MKSFFFHFLAGLMLLCSLGCTKELLVITEVLIERPFYASGEIRDAGYDDFRAFHIMLGDRIATFDSLHPDLPPSSIYWQDPVVDTEQGLSIRSGAYGDQMPGEPLFALQFWPEELTSFQGLTAAGLEAFFQPGRQFPFGKGPGRVDLYLRLPIENPIMIRASRASYLYAPSGTLTITEVEDYQYDFAAWPGQMTRGKRISCTFEGTIGRYDLEADLTDGVEPGFAGTDVAVPVRNGRAVFFISYE